MLILYIKPYFGFSEIEKLARIAFNAYDQVMAAESEYLSHDLGHSFFAPFVKNISFLHLVSRKRLYQPRSGRKTRAIRPLTSNFTANIQTQ